MSVRSLAPWNLWGRSRGRTLTGMSMIRATRRGFHEACWAAIAALLAACGGAAPSDVADTSVHSEAGSDAMGFDGASVDGELDAPVEDASLDVAEQDRAMPDVQRDVARPDHACDPVAAELPMPMGACDGRGMIACEQWAMQNAGGNPNATAICTTMPSGCARADSCSDPADPSTCRCGGSPACLAGNVCVSVGPTAVCRPVVCR
jgi:hypothetical protein